MSFRERVRDLLLVLAIGASISMAFGVAASCVGERAPSPSPGVPTATARADSEAAPARSLETGASGTVVGGDGDSAPLVDTTPLPEMASGSTPAPASTVTQSALQALGSGDSLVPSPTSQVAIAPPSPATPVATSRAVETLAPKSINSYEPWPAYLWPVVECLIQRESGGNAGAVGKAGERGLLQIGVANFGYLATYGITPDMLFHGPTNIRAGWIIYLYWQNATGDGFWPWKSTRGGCA